MSLTLDPRSTALVLIDLQNGILASPLAPHDRDTVTRNGLALARRFLDRKAPVALVNVDFAEGYADLPQGLTDHPPPLPPGGFPAGWADLHPEFDALADSLRVTKRHWGAFFGTELDLQLRRRGIGTIVLGGVSTPIGVEQTAREAWQNNYSVVIAEDACAAAGPGGLEMHGHSVSRLLPRVARVRSTEEILGSFN
jgi:nicotinamidase-related amidase